MRVPTNWDAPFPDDLFPGEIVMMQIIEDDTRHRPAKPFSMRIHTPEGCGQVLVESNMHNYPSPPHTHTICTECAWSWAAGYTIWRPRPGIDN